MGKQIEVTMYPTVHLCLPGDARAAWAARQSLRSFEGYMSSEIVEDVNLLVSELVTNSVKHGSLRADQEIALDVTPTSKGLRVEITNPGGAVMVNELPAKAPESGWGLLLVTRIASRWGIVTNGQTLVWFEIDVKSDHAPSILAV